jgi:hypothetical protein
VLSNDLKYLTLIGADSQAKVDAWDECFEGLMEKIKIFNLDLSPNNTQIRRECFLSGEVFAIGK